MICINRMIYDLEDKHIAFFKQDKSVSIFRNVFAFEPWAALRHLLQRFCSLFKFHCKPLCCCRVDLCQKCGRLDRKAVRGLLVPGADTGRPGAAAHGRGRCLPRAGRLLPPCHRGAQVAAVHRALPPGRNHRPAALNRTQNRTAALCGVPLHPPERRFFDAVSPLKFGPKKGRLTPRPKVVT